MVVRWTQQEAMNSVWQLRVCKKRPFHPDVGSSLKDEVLVSWRFKETKTIGFQSIPVIVFLTSDTPYFFSSLIEGLCTRHKTFHRYRLKVKTYLVCNKNSHLYAMGDSFLNSEERAVHSGKRGGKGSAKVEPGLKMELALSCVSLTKSLTLPVLLSSSVQWRQTLPSWR